MSKEHDEKSNAMEVFAEEFHLVEEAEQVLKDEQVSVEELRDSYKLLVKKYKNLLRQSVKITRIGDSTQSKLIKIQNLLDQQKTELQEVNQKLKDMDQIKATFTAMLVHDLKSPLSVVKGTLEFLEMDDTIREGPMGHLLFSAGQSVEKMINLINEVLEVFRSDSQEMQLDLTLINPTQMLRQCAEESRIAALWNKVTVQTKIPSQLPTILADSSKLNRVFSNLLSNAVKFTPKGGVITLEANTVQGSFEQAGKEFLEIKISDTGEGIPPADLPHLFDPYRQAKSKTAHLGVGLGLAIVKRIVTGHGGTISVQSQMGSGTCFTISLPAISQV